MSSRAAKQAGPMPIQLIPNCVKATGEVGVGSGQQADRRSHHAPRTTLERGARCGAHGFPAAVQDHSRVKPRHTVFAAAVYALRPSPAKLDASLKTGS